MPKSEPIQHTEIDFDNLSDLAASDPEAFEAQRSALIEQVIQRAPRHRQQRLRGLQWRVDIVRERSQTPLAACIRMSEMMWDTLVGEGGLRDSLEYLSNPADAGLLRPAPQNAKVLLFQSQRQSHRKGLS